MSDPRKMDPNLMTVMLLAVVSSLGIFSSGVELAGK
jgi:hypothetical protein